MSAEKALSGPERVEGFQNPESARYDPDLDVWFVSNVNGSPLEKDNNGYVARLGGDGAIDSLKFIAGGANGVTLHAPKGLAIVGDTLWVADIDAARAFDKRTGVPLLAVELAGQGKFLNDVAAGPDGIYLTDTGVGPDAKGAVGHTGPDRIFRVAPDHSATLALESDSLGGPNGIAWDAEHHRFVVVPFFGTTIRGWRPGDVQVVALGTGPGQEDGAEVLGGGRVLISSWADSSLFLLEDGRVTTVYRGLPSAADIGIDTRRGRVAIPLLLENRVEFRSLPGATTTTP